MKNLYTVMIEEDYECSVPFIKKMTCEQLEAYIDNRQNKCGFTIKLEDGKQYGVDFYMMVLLPYAFDARSWWEKLVDKIRRR